MADSLEKELKHTLKRCDEIREKYVSSSISTGWWDEKNEPHLIEIRTDDLSNDHVVSDDESEKLTDVQKYDIIKFLETKAGVIVKENPVAFNVNRTDKDRFLEKLLKPSTIRQRDDHNHENVLNKRFKARIAI